jgi:hypothetical protein
MRAARDDRFGGESPNMIDRRTPSGRRRDYRFWLGKPLSLPFESALNRPAQYARQLGLQLSR